MIEKSNKSSKMELQNKPPNVVAKSGKDMEFRIFNGEL